LPLSNLAKDNDLLFSISIVTSDTNFVQK